MQKNPAGLTLTGGHPQDKVTALADLDARADHPAIGAAVEEVVVGADAAVAGEAVELHVVLLGLGEGGAGDRADNQFIDATGGDGGGDGGRGDRGDKGSRGGSGSNGSKYVEAVEWICLSASINNRD